MLQESSFPNGQKHRRWTEDEILVLLCSLNSEIERIREKFDTDRNEGINLASIKLSKAVGNDCSPARVTWKIEHLLRECGPSSSYRSNSIDPIYRFGAWTRTLPRLDALYPGMLEKIALAGKIEQSTKVKSDTRPPRVKNLRRREKDKMADPIECSCGFAHFASSCVHCESCLTWQHIWCYYGSDNLEAAPYDHTCRKCAGYDDDDQLVKELQRLNLEFCESAANLTRKRTVRSVDSLDLHRKKSSTTYGCNDEFLLFGPSDGEVQSIIRLVTSMIRSITHSVDTEDLEIQMPPADDAGKHSDLYEALRGGEYRHLSTMTDLSSLDNFLLLKMVISSAIWNWTFYDSSTSSLAEEVKQSPEALLEAYHSVLLSYDSKLLQYIHRKAWTKLLSDRPDVLEPIIRKKAGELARRLLCMLSSAVKRSKTSGDTRPLKTAEDWINRTKSGKSRFNVLLELFVKCIKLKYTLPLSEYCYELYFPASSESQFMSTDPDEQNREIKFCFAPAILEFEPEVFEMVGPDGCVLFGEQNFIRATNEQRMESRIVCPAVGMFYG